jgi:hypothetical protein
VKNKDYPAVKAAIFGTDADLAVLVERHLDLAPKSGSKSALFNRNAIKEFDAQYSRKTSSLFETPKN